MIAKNILTGLWSDTNRKLKKKDQVVKHFIFPPKKYKNEANIK